MNGSSAFESNSKLEVLNRILWKMFKLVLERVPQNLFRTSMRIAWTRNCIWIIYLILIIYKIITHINNNLYKYLQKQLLLIKYLKILQMKRRNNERKEKYESVADIIIDGDMTVEKTVTEILKLFSK